MNEYDRGISQISSFSLARFFLHRVRLNEWEKWAVCSATVLVCVLAKRKIIDFHFHFHMKRVTSKSLWLLTLTQTRKTSRLLHLVDHFFSPLLPGVMQATTGESWEKRYSPSFRDSDPLRRQSSTKRKRDEVLRLVSQIVVISIHHYHSLIRLLFRLLLLFLLPFLVIVAVQGRFAIER
jgi:hypothetical protein